MNFVVTFSLMNTISFIFIINATLLLLHEIESAYVREWEILKIPGKITVFLLLHIPILLFLFWGLIEIEKQTSLSQYIALIAGIGGMMPFMVHKIMAKRVGYFDSIISNAVIFLNMLTGIVIIAMSLI